MAHASTLTMALAAPPAASAHPGMTSSSLPVRVAALMTPPSSTSPDLPARPGLREGPSPPPTMDFEQEPGLGDIEEHPGMEEEQEDDTPIPAGMPLSRGALSGLDASAAITSSMLAKHHLPAIMLGNGPKPIRDVMGELTQSVPGFSRIPPARARRLVVAALESRAGGGPDGSVAFCKTGWGRWDAHVKASFSSSARDSGIGCSSFGDGGHMSPPRSERSSIYYYARSHSDSAVHLGGGGGAVAPRPSRGCQRSGGSSWSASSRLREEDERDVLDMDVLEHEADKMSLDEDCVDDDESDDSFDDATDEEEDLPPAASFATPAAMTTRKASLPPPPPTLHRKNYNKISVEYARRWSWRSRRPSAGVIHSTSLPTTSSCGVAFMRSEQPGVGGGNPTPEEQAAAAALLSMGSM